MSLRPLRRLVLIAPMLLLLLGGVFGGTVTAQDEGETGAIIDAILDVGDYPVAPAFVRLLRITLEPESSSPLHTHPGPEIVVVERGTLTVQVDGAAELSLATNEASPGTPTTKELAPVGSEFEMTAGDQLIYLPQTPMTFRNAGDETVSLLTVVLLPAGHQHPPGVTYINGQPDASAFDGVTPQILGDGVASSMPTGGIRVVVDRLDVDAGAPIPAQTNQAMLSLQQGGLDFTVIGGKVQISRGATPGPQPDASPGTATNLAINDAIFVPIGLQEAPRPEDDGPISFLRLAIFPVGSGKEPTTTGEGVGVIQVTGTEVSADGTPVAGEANGSSKTPPANASPSPTATPTGPKEGDSLPVNSDGVNMRACGSTDCEVVTQVFFGQTVTIIGPSEDDGTYIWWPVSLDDDPSITGYIAQDFLDLPESGE